jgi:hypothetical protein
MNGRALYVFHLASLWSLRLSGYDRIYYSHGGPLARTLAKIRMAVGRCRANVIAVPPGSEIKGFPAIDIACRERAGQLLFERAWTEMQRALSPLDPEAVTAFCIKCASFGSVIHFGFPRLHVGFSNCMVDIGKVSALLEGEPFDCHLAPFFPRFDILIPDQARQIETADRGFWRMILKASVWLHLAFRMLPRTGALRWPLPADRSFQLATEVGHPAFMQGRGGQANYLCDKEHLPERDVLFYKSSYSMIDVADVSYEKLEQSGSFVDLRKLKLWTLRECWQHLRHLGHQSFGSLLELQLYAYAIYFGTEYAVLLRQGRVRAHVHLTFTNDKRRARFDGGLATAWARACGVCSFSYQTRPVLSYCSDFCMDCFDIFFAWSPFWVPRDHLYFKGLKRIEYCGNVHAPMSQRKSPLADDTVRIVSVFNADISLNSYNTLGHNLGLMKAVMVLADRYPDIRFILKPKFRSQADALLAELPPPPENFEVYLGDYDTEKLIAESFVVMALAFTSPGFDAMAAGVNTIYYSELGHRDHPVDQLEVVCRSVPEVEALFERYMHGQRVDASLIEGGPDAAGGSARDRILPLLMQTLSNERKSGAASA